METTVQQPVMGQNGQDYPVTGNGTPGPRPASAWLKSWRPWKR